MTHFVITGTEAFIASLIVAFIGLYLVGWFKELFAAWRLARHYAKCSHEWRHMRGQMKFASGSSASWPARTCDKCGKVERT